MENQKEIIKSLAVIESLLSIIILGISMIIIIFAESPIYIFCGLFLTLFSVAIRNANWVMKEWEKCRKED